jgi:hypothetical protein
MSLEGSGTMLRRRSGPLGARDPGKRTDICESTETSGWDLVRRFPGGESRREDEGKRVHAHANARRRAAGASFDTILRREPFQMRSRGPGEAEVGSGDAGELEGPGRVCSPLCCVGGYVNTGVIVRPTHSCIHSLAAEYSPSMMTMFMVRAYQGRRPGRIGGVGMLPLAQFIHLRPDILDNGRRFPACRVCAEV